MWTLFVQPSDVHITEVLLYILKTRFKRIMQFGWKWAYQGYVSWIQSKEKMYVTLGGTSNSWTFCPPCFGSGFCYVSSGRLPVTGIPKKPHLAKLLNQNKPDKRFRNSVYHPVFRPQTLYSMDEKPSNVPRWDNNTSILIFHQIKKSLVHLSSI